MNKLILKKYVGYLSMNSPHPSGNKPTSKDLLGENHKRRLPRSPSVPFFSAKLKTFSVKMPTL